MACRFGNPPFDAAAMKDPRMAKLMNPAAMPFDGKRLIFGGFKVAVDL